MATIDALKTKMREPRQLGLKRHIYMIGPTAYLTGTWAICLECGAVGRGNPDGEWEDLPQGMDPIAALREGEGEE